MWNEAVIRQLDQLKEQVNVGGGAARIEKQHQKGKLTARERLDILFDPETFHELQEMVECRTTDFGMDEKRVPGDGVVGGFGYIGGRLVFAISQDFTVCGGSGGEEYALKMCHVLEKAIEMRAPFININDSGGARIEEGISSLSAYSRLFYLNTVASGMIPQISVIMGPCAGGASYSPALCDFIFMVEKTSRMYLTGPAVIKTVTGEDVTEEELGGTSVHMGVSGNAHFAYPNEEDCLSGVKRLLTYLPQNCGEKPLSLKGTFEENSGSIAEIVPEKSSKPYDVRRVIETIADKDSFMEVQRLFAQNVVVGFARMEGETVGFVANQPVYKAGALDCDAADKASRFIRTCDCFNIPIVSLVDVPAFLPGVSEERRGIIRHGAKLLYAFSEASVPKVCLIMRKAYGGAYCAMNSKSMSADVVYAWPIAEVAVMGENGAVNVIFHKQIAAADDPDAERDRLVAEYRKMFMNPYFAAKRGFVDEVIYPEETREKLCASLAMLTGKKAARLDKKHGNMPL